MIPYSLNSLYGLLGISKQAVHDYQRRQDLFDQELQDLLVQVEAIRRENPGCGVKKLYDTLQPSFMGRDKFCEIFLDLGFGVRKVVNRRKTTIPTHIRYPNLIKGMQIMRPYQVLQSDITYFELDGKFYYLVFIIDVYTREILGHFTSDSLRVEANIKAMKIALNKMTYEPWQCIHHSDHGSQYCSNAYRELLSSHKIHASMGLTAQDNSYAERINGTIKNEYLKRWLIKDEKDLKRKVNRAVDNYNNKRKHMAFGNKLTPAEFRKKVLDLNTQERPKVIIYTEENYEIKEASSLLHFNPREEPQAHNCPIRIK